MKLLIEENQMLFCRIEKSFSFSKIFKWGRGDSGEAVLGLFMSDKTVFEIFSCGKTVFVIAVNGIWTFGRFSAVKPVFGYF